MATKKFVNGKIENIEEVEKATLRAIVASLLSSFADNTYRNKPGAAVVAALVAGAVAGLTVIQALLGA